MKGALGIFRPYFYELIEIRFKMLRKVKKLTLVRKTAR